MKELKQKMHRSLYIDPFIQDCDVFLCFRGEVRQSFTCHLSEALQRLNFRPFMDNENIDLGEKIDDTIKKAIKYSKSAIVILSNEFASSKHCLNELVLILERNRTSKYFVIPIFYYVETDDVKHQLGKFGAGLEQLKKHHNNGKMEEWRAALAQIGGILGEEIKEKNGLMESTIIKDIIATFEQKFNDHYPERLQQNQVIPAATTSNIIDTAESSETPSKVEDTWSVIGKRICDIFSVVFLCYFLFVCIFLGMFILVAVTIMKVVNKFPGFPDRFLEIHF